LKIAEVWDFTAYLESFYIKDGKAVSFKTNEPYSYRNSVSPECFLQGPVYSHLWEGSYFLNLEEYDGVPPYDPDVNLVFYVNERVGLMNEHYDKYSVESIRKQFPNAVIVGQVKEVPPSFNSGDVYSDIPRRQVRPERPENRIRFFNDCDFVNVPTTPDGLYAKDEYFVELQKHLNKEIKYTPGPTNVDYVFDHYYSNEKLNSIFYYTPHQHERRGDTEKFAKYLGNKYKLEVFSKPIHDNQPFDYLSSHDFIKLWSPHIFHINVDPMKMYPGQQCRQVAAVGSINIGGENDSHHRLYPDASGCDLKKLEHIFEVYLKDSRRRFGAIEYAYNKVNELFGFNTVRKILEETFLNVN
tara:strand:+ start:168 stop:1232 length:1065 start_codon:yes stop_codon:yes gene_type:complete